MNAKLNQRPQFRPIYCNACSSIDIYLVSAGKFYQREFASDKGLMYVCRNCDASVQCHDGTVIPLGTMANKSTRSMRQKAHFVFDAAWQKTKMSRNEAYEWLARKMNLTRKECHIGMFDQYQCSSVIDLCQNGIQQ